MVIKSTLFGGAILCLCLLPSLALEAGPLFGYRTDFSTGGDGPSWLAIADLDCDGDQDFAVVNRISWEISLMFFQQGSRLLEGTVALPGENTPSYVNLAHLDTDSFVDMVEIVLLPDSQVSIHRGMCDSTFHPPDGYTIGLMDPFAQEVYACVIDLDGDSDLDLAIPASWVDSLYILKNNGDATFQTPVPYPAGNNPWAIACCDLDADSDVDLILTHRSNANVSVHKNNGNGTFLPGVFYAAGDIPIAIDCADLDNDGDMDLVVANFGSNDVTILYNNGDGTFPGAILLNAGSAPVAVFCADFNMDGYNDFAVANDSSDDVYVFKFSPVGGFELPEIYAVGDGPRSLACADMDGDGDLDLVTANFNSDNITILRNLTFCPAMPGDVNGTDPISLPDVIYLVNYVFDKDRPATSCLSSDPGNCWTPDPLCQGEVNGTAPTSLPDVIHLVNYVFDKDRPATSCLGSDPGNCWIPLPTDVCCLPVQ